MGVDLHRIGTGISSGSSRNGFGNIVSFPSVPAGNLPEGTYISTLYEVPYAVAQGGEAVTIDEIAYPSQFCDVDVEADGSGGTQVNWGTASNIGYFTSGTITTITSTQTPVELPAPHEGTYFDSEVKVEVFTHDGTGSYTVSGDWAYYADNTLIVGSPSTNQQAEVPSGSSSYHNNGKYDTYAWDGAGAIESITLGSFYAGETVIYISNNQTEVPSGSSNYFDNGQTTIYKWNGSGGYTSIGGGAYYDEDVYITDDGTTAYYWSGDGTGGYYSQAL